MKVVSLSGVIPIALTLVLTLHAMAQDAAGKRSPCGWMGSGVARHRLASLTGS